MLPDQGGPQERLALPLLIMMAQQRNHILTSSKANHVKLIGELYDRCQEALFLVRPASLPGTRPSLKPSFWGFSCHWCQMLNERIS